MPIDSLNCALEQLAWPRDAHNCIHRSRAVAVWCVCVAVALAVCLGRSSSAAAVGNSSSRSGVVTRAVPIDLGNLTQEQLYAGGAVLSELGLLHPVAA